MKRSLVPLLLGALTACGTLNPPQAPTTAALLPLTGDLGAHDPTLFRVGQTPYVFSTGLIQTEDNPGGILMHRSKGDLGGEWETIGAVPVPEWVRKNYRTSNVWAPNVVKNGDTYYLYYSASEFGKNHSAIGLATSKTPADPASWQDQGAVLKSEPGDNYNAIDPAVFNDGGQWWMAFGSFWSGIKLQKLDDMRRPTGEMYSLASRPGVPANPVEGPAIVKRGGYYYLFVSWDICCQGAKSTYRTAVGRARTITGPYVDKDGKRLDQGGGTVVLSSRPDGQADLAGAGGGDVMQEGQNTYLVYHSYRKTDGAPLMSVRRMGWKDDWPVLSLTPPTPAPSGTFQNPVLDRGADPYLNYHQGAYYLTTTNWNAISVIKAGSVTDLKNAPRKVVWTDTDPTRCCNVWAPEMHLLQGPNGPRWYIYYTAGHAKDFGLQRSYVLESTGTDPLGPYTFKGQLRDTGNDDWAIDGTVFQKADGSLTYFWSGMSDVNGAATQSIYAAPMSNPWTLSGPRVLLSAPTHDWEKMGGPPNVNEGPELIAHGDRLFMTYSASGCWTPDYKLGLLSAPLSGNLLDPAAWTKSDKPVFQTSVDADVFAPGHNGFFKSPDGKEDWMIYHAVSATNVNCTDERSARIQKITWKDDGTPDFGAPISLDTPLPLPSGDPGSSLTAQRPVSGAVYRVLNDPNSLCLNNEGGGLTAGTNINLSTCTGAAGQDWKLEAAGDAYRLAHVQSGLCLDVKDGATAPGTNVQLGPCTDSPAQTWTLRDAGSGAYTLLNVKDPAVALDNAFGNPQPGANVQVWSDNSLGPQRWRFDRR